MVFDENGCVSSILASVFLTVLYVASLYVWRSKLSRDHPTTIKRRFFSVSCVMVLAPFVTWLFLKESTLSKGDMYEQLGMRVSGLLFAFVTPLVLTMILFLGPLTMQFLSGSWKVYINPIYWFASWQDLTWVRNHIVAPISEEWVFRACMMPLLLQCLEPYTAVFVGPLLFGIAHFHHMFEQIKLGLDIRSSIMISAFQFLYTSLFGAYSAYLFLRTGHFVAPLAAHMFCNHMGFPNFGDIPYYPLTQRLLIVSNMVLGFTIWCNLLTPLTDPAYYDNKLFWQSRFQFPNDISLF